MSFKNKLGLFTLTITIGTLLSSCSTFNKMAVGSGSDLIFNASNGALEESNYEVFKQGIAGNLLLIEGLLGQSPTNLNLLATLNKGYAGYAFAINETQMYEEEWAESKSQEGRTQALFNYTRALNFGLRYLKEKDVELRDILSGASNEDGIKKLLEKKLSDDKQDLELVLFTAQSLAGLINLQKDNMGLVSQLPAAKGMFDWVCSKKPSINYGTCDIFYGAYEAGRPQMLGGNPQKGKEIFLKAIAKHPHNWLIRTSFMQFYLIPQNDEEGFKEQLLAMKIFHDDFSKYYIYDQNPRVDGPWTRESGLRFYQTLSLKRYGLMTRFQKQFF
ncbi:MAG: TRAP transporter TatT component family protein [Bdellovibrionales bacterium]|nr:TRAP transporter TatT component family protein [Bdellovibrionales bacterium]